MIKIHFFLILPGELWQIQASWEKSNTLSGCSIYPLTLIRKLRIKSICGSRFMSQMLWYIILKNFFKNTACYNFLQRILRSNQSSYIKSNNCSVWTICLATLLKKPHSKISFGSGIIGWKPTLLVLAMWWKYAFFAKTLILSRLIVS